jgi:hypothetical protein
VTRRRLDDATIGEPQAKHVVACWRGHVADHQNRRGDSPPSAIKRPHHVAGV